MDLNYCLKTKLKYEQKHDEEKTITVSISISANHQLENETIRVLESHFLKDDVMSHYECVNKPKSKKKAMCSKR